MAPNETKHDKFLRLAEARTPKALEAIRLVGQLSSANYENTDEEAQELTGVLQEAVDTVKSLFGVSGTTQTQTPVSEAPTSTPAHVFPDPVVLSSREMNYDGPIDADDIRSVIQLLVYQKDVEGAVRMLRNALIQEPRDA